MSFSVVIRLRRGVFGYRRSDLTGEIHRLELTIEQLRVGLREGWRRRTELERETEALRSEVEQLRARDEEVGSALAAVNRRAVEVEELAQDRARAIFADAEVQAALLRAELTEQIDELISAKDSFSQQLRGAVSDLGEVLGKFDVGAPIYRDQPRANGLRTSGRPGSVSAAPSELARVFPARLELEVGPFDGFGSLSAFESSLAELATVERVRVQRFAGDRATLEVCTTEPVPFLAAIGGRLPYDVDLVEADDARLSLTVNPT
jgi:hypothetical protein